MFPGLRGLAEIDAFHGDAVVDGADELAEVAADALLLIDVGDAVRRCSGRVEGSLGVAMKISGYVSD